MSKLSYFALCASFALMLGAPVTVSANNYSLLPVSNAPELGGAEGYLLLFVEAGGSAPSFEFARITKAGAEPLERGARYRFASKPKSVSLKGLDEGLYLMPLRKGQYQITQVNAPHYNLPFRMDTENRPEWRFVIEPGKSNYIGTLQIESERSTSHVEINFLNRIAMHKALIEESMGDTLITYPLSFFAGYRDDFFPGVLGTTAMEGDK